MIVATPDMLFGPYLSVITMSDRLRCDGADLPFSVIGPYEIIDPELPPGFMASLYLWNGTELVHK